ncbi:MAG: DUF2029 domain-containing protein [Bacteroidia bacterium]|nr:DUF2029 domain-containing protein [Bacteroidia bacterium]
MKTAIFKFFSALVSDTRLFGFVILLICTATSLQHYIYTPAPGTIDFKYNYTRYNDFLIFKYSFYHLIHHQNLYIMYPYEYYDLFKYTPTFALLMAPFALLPNLAGLILWNFVGAAILFFAIRRLHLPGNKSTLFVIGFVLIEAITSLQNSESNCLLAGLFLLAFTALENKKTAQAAFFIVLSAFVKPFGLAFFTLFIFYPSKPKAIVYSAVWFAVLLLLPLVTGSADYLISTYHDWGITLFRDHSESHGFSVMGWLYTWFGIDQNFPVLFAGMVLLLLPLLRYRNYKSKQFRILFFASLLIWVVIFNHLAESPTFVIAITGVAIWYSQSPSKINFILLLLCFFFSVLAPTDVIPPALRSNYFVPYVVKSVPCIFIWLKTIYELLATHFIPTDGTPVLKEA